MHPKFSVLQNVGLVFSPLFLSWQLLSYLYGFVVSRCLPKFDSYMSPFSTVGGHFHQNSFALSFLFVDRFIHTFIPYPHFPNPATLTDMAVCQDGHSHSIG